MLTALAMVSGCGELDISEGPWVAEVFQLGDTTVVRTVSGSIWERPARLSEELRLGSIDEAEETSFGAISHAAVAEDGSVFLYDAQVPQIYHFGASGKLLALIGREGEGPGEYSDRVNGVIIAGSRLLVSDPGTRRLSAFSSDGVYQGSLGPVGGLRSLFSPTLAYGLEGGIAEKILTVAPEPGVELPTPWPIGLELRDIEGDVLDTIGPQTLAGGPGRLEAGPGGNGILVGSETDFLFEVRRNDGEVVRIEMPFERVEYTEAEERVMGRALVPVGAADGQAEADLPALKETYLEYLFTTSGRIWARRPVPDPDGEPSWRMPQYQPSVMDVFDVDGSYLGVVRLPASSRPVAVTDTHLYVVELGAYEEPYLVRYRVAAPG